MSAPYRAALPVAALVAMLAGGCQPTVRVEVPDKPITINLNVKIEQEIRVKVERDVEALLDSKEDIF